MELQHNGSWRMAVWALRVGYVGLAIAVAGLIALAFGSTPWVVASGVIIWLATVPVTLTGFPLDAARATRAPTQAVVDAADAHPRLRPPRVVGRLGRCSQAPLVTFPYVAKTTVHSQRSSRPAPKVVARSNHRYVKP